jgi:hypothetical protein
MKLIVRRVLIGLVCGTVSRLFLCSAVRNVGLGHLRLGLRLDIRTEMEPSAACGPGINTDENGYLINYGVIE